LVLGFALFGAGLWCTADWLGIRDHTTLEQYRIYATVLVGGSAFTAFWSILPDSLVKAHHDTRSTMWAGLISGGLNVLLNTLFVYGFGWAIFGIAFSTVLSRLGGYVYAVGRAAHHERLRLASADPTEPTAIGTTFERPVRVILGLAVPGSVTFMLMSVEALAVRLLMAPRADATELLAAWTIYDLTARFMAMPAIATAVAVLPFVARARGRGDLTLIRREFVKLVLVGLLYVVAVVWVVAWSLGPWVATELAASTQTLAFATLAIRFVPLDVLGLAPFEIARAAFDGLARPRPALLVALLRSLVLMCPLVAGGLLLADANGWPSIFGACGGRVIALATSAAILVALLLKPLNATRTTG
jgi:Na+-driven multidrug efflux pump